MSAPLLAQVYDIFPLSKQRPQLCAEQEPQVQVPQQGSCLAKSFANPTLKCFQLVILTIMI